MGHISDWIGYSPSTGRLYWKQSRRGIPKDKTIKCVDARGYIRVVYNGKPFQGHRLAWFLHHGYWPEIIDHKNGNKTDNRIRNLRNVDRTINAAHNHVKRSDSTQKYQGVYLLPSDRYNARYRRKSLGTYDTAEEAYEVYINHKKALIRAGG